MNRKELMSPKITFLDKINDELEQKIEDGHADYEKGHGVDVNYKSFAITIADEQNNICGVLNAYTAYAEIYIEDIWVEKSSRGKGYGRSLLQALEEQFKGQGFNNINLVTSAFQAPEFYKKCGYTVEFTRINQKNPQLTKTFFIKYFNELVETQGIINTKI